MHPFITVLSNNNLLDFGRTKNMWILSASDFNPTNNFIRIWSFNHSFVVANVDVSYYNSCQFVDVPNTFKPEINGNNENIILIILVFTSSLFHLLIKQKSNVIAKLIPLVIFFFVGCSIKHLQYNAPYQDINVCIRSRFFAIESKNSYFWLLVLLSGDLSLNPGLTVSN